MATKTGLQTLNHKDILEVDGNPAINGGTSANDPGSIALVNNEGTGEIWLKTGDTDTDWQKLLTSADAGVGTGDFLRLAIFDTVGSGTHLDDQVVQNGQNISVKIDAQASRTAGIEYLIPNPGDDVSSVSFVLTEGAQTINGDKTFGDNVIISGDLTVNGTLTYINTTNLEVTDKLIRLNKGGAADSAGGAGLEFEEDGVVSGYLKLSSDRAGFELLAPGAGHALTLDANLLTGARTISAPDADGIAVLRNSASLPVAGQVTYWDNENQVTGSAGLTYDSMGSNLTVAGGLSAQNSAFQVQANGALYAAQGNFTVSDLGAVYAADGGFNIAADGSFNAANSKFAVDANGDLTKINNVSYSFPTSQAAGANYALLNDGSGALSWGKVAITLQDAYDNSCLGSGSGGGNSGGQPTLTYMTGNDSAGMYQVTWSAANATGKYVQLQKYSASAWMVVANLGLATSSSGSATSSMITNGASLRLKLFDDYMYTQATSPEVISSSWTASIGGGSGGSPSISMVYVNPTSVAGPSSLDISWSAQNIDSTAYYYLWEVTGPGMYGNPIYLTFGTNQSGSVLKSAINPSKYYVVGAGSMSTGVPPTTVSNSFQIPQGTGGSGSGGGTLSISNPMAAEGTEDPSYVVLSWSLSNAGANDYFYLWKATGVVPTVSYTYVAYLGMGPSATQNSVLKSLIDPTANYVVGGPNMDTSTPPTVVSSSFQIPQGTGGSGSGGGPASISLGMPPYTISGTDAVISFSASNAGAYPYVGLYEATGMAPTYSYTWKALLNGSSMPSGTIALSQLDPAKTYTIGLMVGMNDASPAYAASMTFSVAEGTGGAPATPETTISSYSSLMNSFHQVAFAGAAKFGQKIVVAGGAGLGYATSNQVSFIDVAADAVTTTTSLSVARYLPAVAANSSYVIVAGGYAAGHTGSSVLDVYSEATQSWSAKTLTNRRYKSSAVEIGGLFYILGGMYFDQAQETYVDQLNLDIYNPATDTLSSGAPMLNPHVQGEAVVASDGKIYYGSGESATNKLDVYDPATNSWQSLTVPGGARSRSSILTIGGKVYVAGGSNASAQVTSEVQIYDIAQGTWLTATNLPEARAAMSATVLGNKLLFLGGAVNGNQTSNSLYVYDTVTGLWGSKSTINTGDGLGFAAGNKAVFLGFAGNFYPTGQVFYFTDSSLLGSGGARGRLGAPGSLGCEASITTNSQIGDLIVAGTEAFIITTAGGLLVGSGFAVDADGETLKTNGVTYTFPAAQGLSGQVLKNDGMGVLSWDYPMAIGDKVDAGTSGSLLFVDASGNLAQNNANLYWDATNQRLGLGTDEPAARLDVNGDAIFRGELKQLAAAAPFANWTRAQAQVETTDATETSALALAIPDNSVVMLRAYVLARRSGGAAGAELDSGVYIRTARIKKVNGVASLHAMQTDYTSEDQRGWSATIQTTGDNDAHVYVTGAADNTIDWTVNYEYIVLDGTSGSGGGNSGGQQTLSLGSASQSGSNYDIMWNFTGDVTGKYVNLDLMSGGSVQTTALLGLANTGYASVPLAGVQNGMVVRLRLFNDNMGASPVSPEVASSTWTISISGGGGGGGGNTPTFSIGQISSATGTVSIPWTAANASVYPEIGLYKINNPGPMQSYTFIQNVSNTMSMPSGTVSGLSWGLFNPVYTYTLGLASTGMEQTPVLLDATGFTVADGTLIPVVESAGFGSELMGSDIAVQWGASNVDTSLYAWLQKYDASQLMWVNVVFLGYATNTSGSVLLGQLENGAQYRVAIETNPMMGSSPVGTSSSGFYYLEPSTITYISTSQVDGDQVFNWSSVNASTLYVGLQKQSGPGMYDAPIMLGAGTLTTASVAISQLTDGANYRLALYSDSAGTTAVSGGASASFLVDFTIPATLTYSANTPSGSNQVITWTAANASGLYVGLQRFLTGPATWDSPIMLGSESDGTETIAQSLLINGDTYRLQLYSDSAGTTAVSNTATSGFTMSLYLQYQWQGTGVDQTGITLPAELVSLTRLAQGSGSATLSLTSSSNISWVLAQNFTDDHAPVVEAGVDALLADPGTPRAEYIVYNAAGNTSLKQPVLNKTLAYLQSFAFVAAALNGAKVGEVRIFAYEYSGVLNYYAVKLIAFT